MALVTVALYLMYGVHVSSGWTTLLAGFLVGGVGIGMVNPALATTAVGVVPPQRAGMAGLGAIFQASYTVGGTRADFVHGLNQILLVATFVAAAGTVLGFALVRSRDFVVSGPAAAGH